jgi:adenylate kinase family enzyme
MNKYLVTGVATSGKTTIARELQKRGYSAFDTEPIKGLHVWIEKATGKSLPPDLEITSAADWVDRYDPSWDEKRLRQLLDTPRSEPTFFCGSAANQEGLYGLFDKVFLLAIDDQTLIRRLQNADRENEFGRRPGELEVILGWYKAFQDRTKASGAIIIDATQPLDKVINEILTKAGITYEPIGKSKNNVSVVYDPVYSHAATHLDDTPRLKDLVAEIISKMDLQGQRVATDVDMGRVVGTCDVVVVDNTDEIVYAMRKNRETDGLVPFTKTREPEPCRHVAIQLTPKTDGSYELASAWIGTFGDDEPFPEAPDATDKSAEYWNHHAFVWESQEIIPGTETTVCPW